MVYNSIIHHKSNIPTAPIYIISLCDIPIMVAFITVLTFPTSMFYFSHLSLK